MIIKSTRHLNLHSKSYEHTRADHQGLVHVPANTAVSVPDDVQDHPSFKLLTKDGTVKVLKRGVAKKPSDEEIQASQSKAEDVKPDPDAEGEVQNEEPQSLIPAAESVDEEENEDDEEEDVEDTEGSK